MKTVELLISCMNLENTEILTTTNVRSDVLLVDQCGKDALEEETFRGFRVRHLKCDEKGLSRSRNRAIENARCDIGLICDDDETLKDEYPSIIAGAYEQLPDADLVCFRMANQPSRLKQEVQRINKWTALRIASWQISMRPEAVRKSGVRFDPLMGAGSGNGAGEEVKFLRDCIKAGLRVYYVPEDIGTVDNHYYESGEAEGSSWFTGFDSGYFYQRGGYTRYMLGLPVSFAYAFYYVYSHRDLYRNHISGKNALRYTLKGIFDDPIGKQSKNGKN